MYTLRNTTPIKTEDTDSTPEVFLELMLSLTCNHDFYLYNHKLNLAWS